jgi:hypothetical protein
MADACHTSQSRYPLGGFGNPAGRKKGGLQFTVYI